LLCRFPTKQAGQKVGHDKDSWSSRSLRHNIRSRIMIAEGLGSGRCESWADRNHPSQERHAGRTPVPQATEAVRHRVAPASLRSRCRPPQNSLLWGCRKSRV
jgi:hypothetical protein